MLFENVTVHATKYLGLMTVLSEDIPEVFFLHPKKPVFSLGLYKSTVSSGSAPKAVISVFPKNSIVPFWLVTVANVLHDATTPLHVRA